jgi:thioredoxin reductase (NADPH)
MDYDNVPTTVFAPIEYGCVGLSEEEATQRYGASDLEVYHVQWQPLEWKLNYERYEEKCYAKLVRVWSMVHRLI